MPIVNSVFKSRNSFASEFFCPHCLTTRPYNFKMMSEQVLLSLIPGLSTSAPAHVVECRTCHYAFDPEILKRFRHFVNSDAPDSNVVFVSERGQKRPARSGERKETLEAA